MYSILPESLIIPEHIATQLQSSLSNYVCTNSCASRGCSPR